MNTKDTKQPAKKRSNPFTWVIKKFPFVTFLVVLAALFGLIYWSNALRQEEVSETEATEKVASVTLYEPGQAYLTTQAKVTDKGVVTVYSQSGGVVQRVNVTEGQQVYRGRQLVSLSSNYQGANASALQLELAEKNWLMTHANFWDQEKVDDINYELNRNSAWMTEWQTNGGSGSMGNGDAYTSYSGKQNLELLKLSDTMTQRGQQLSLDQAENNYFAAQIQASLMYPATPVAGTVEKVYVKVGDIVSAGAPIAIIKNSNAAVKLEVTLPENVIRNLSLTAPAWFEIDGARYEVALDFIPTTPTTGNSYYLTMTLDGEAAEKLANGTFVNINMPLDTAGSGRLLLPLNAIYQTQTTSYAYVVDVDDNGNPIARQRSVTLGPVIGTLVTVENGISLDDRIILNNDLMDGERISYPISNLSSGNTTYPILTIPTSTVSAVLFLE